MRGANRHDNTVACVLYTIGGAASHLSVVVVWEVPSVRYFGVHNLSRSVSFVIVVTEDYIPCLHQ